jgi:hypothetical protein
MENQLGCLNSCYCFFLIGRGSCHRHKILQTPGEAGQGKRNCTEIKHWWRETLQNFSTERVEKSNKMFFSR